jgi:hypothetical protein
MQPCTRYLIVDGHSVIFAWPELRKLHARRSSLARESLIKQLRDYQDWTGVRVVVVFDGKGRKIDASSDPGEVQIFYSRSGQSADAIIERLASKYATEYDLVVATSDLWKLKPLRRAARNQFHQKVSADFFPAPDEDRIVSSRAESRDPVEAPKATSTGSFDSVHFAQDDRFSA